MRIVVFSDTHQNTELFVQCTHQAMDNGKIDVLIHCGDGVRDLEAIESELLRRNPHIRLYAVRGNCDLTAFQYPGTETANLNGVRALITHGHLYRVKHGLGPLARAAADMGARIAFFGHTHQPLTKEKHGVRLINPGSLATLLQAGNAYLQVTVDEAGTIQERFIKIQS